MERTFRTTEFLKDLAQDLVTSFDRAGRATTPGLVGAARESAVRKQIESVFPPISAIGSGCIIDSYGSSSKQQDVVVYERAHCPVFSVNQSPDTTYYPCEGVIAVGEVKSTLDRAGLEDSFEKIASVKSLQRHCEDPESWRNYGSNLAALGTPEERFDQKGKLTDQIFGFIVCGGIRLSERTFLSTYRDLSSSLDPWLRPNVLVSLQNGCIVHVSRSDMKIYMDSSKATGVALTTIPDGNFQYLLTRLNWLIIHGRTTEIMPFQRYVLEGDGSMQVLGYEPYPGHA
jgi:hypothetical protein